MKRLLIGAAAFALAFSAALLTPPFAIAHEGPAGGTIHSDAVANEEALRFLQLLAPTALSERGVLLGAYTDEERKEVTAFTLREVLAGATDPATQAQRIHAWMSTNIRFSAAGDKHDQRPTQVLKERVAGGVGFANLYKAMLDAVSIPNTVVSGVSTQGVHQWNVLLLNGEYFYSDASGGKDSFRKSLRDFSVDHATVHIHGVSMSDGAYEYEYKRGVSLKGVKGAEHSQALKVPSSVKAMPVVGVSEEVFSTPGLNTLYLPTSVTRVDTRAGTGSLTCFEVAEGHASFAVEGCALFTADKAELLAYPMAAPAVSFTLPAATRSLDEDNAFAAPALGTLNVHADNTTYAAHEGALYSKDFSSLRAIPGGMKRLVVHGKTTVKEGAFSQKNSLDTIVFEPGVRTIPSRAFTMLPALRQVVFPDSLESLAPDAFASIEAAKVTLVGKKGSVVERYAAERGFPFRANETEPPANPLPPANPAPPTHPQPPTTGPGTGGKTPASPHDSPQPERPEDTVPSPETGQSPEEGSSNETAPPAQPPLTTPTEGTELSPTDSGSQEPLAGSSLQDALSIGENTPEGMVPSPSEVDPAAEKALKPSETAAGTSPLESAVVEGKINPAELGAGIEKIGLTTDLTLSPGATMTVVASGYASNEYVTFVMNVGSKTMGLVRADSMGIAKVTWTIPQDFTPGEHTVLAIGTTGKTLKMPVTVAAFPDLKKSPVSAVKRRPSETRSIDLLAQTGAHSAKAAAVVALCVGAGVTVLVLRRRVDDPLS